MTFTSDTGSSTTMPALAMASLKPIEPAILKLISDESTEWYLPSKHSTRTSTTGKPWRPPPVIVSSMPFCTAGMNWRGMAPPTILSTNSKPPPRSRGATRSQATPYWPCPPDCFLYLPSASAWPVIVSR